MFTGCGEAKYSFPTSCEHSYQYKLYATLSRDESAFCAQKTRISTLLTVLEIVSSESASKSFCSSERLYVKLSRRYVAKNTLIAATKISLE